MFFIHRILKNYECHPGSSYLRLPDILSHLNSDEEMKQLNGGQPFNNSQAKLRTMIRDIWGSKVIFTAHSFQKKAKRTKAVKNLRRKDLSSALQSELDSATSKHLIMVPGWQVVINNDKSLSILQLEDWLVEGQRVVTEIRADQGEGMQYNCTISSHGRKVDPKDLGLKLGQMSNPKEELELLAKCISGSQLCRGFDLPDPGLSTCSDFKVFECSNAAEPDTTEKKVFSSKCQIVAPSKSKPCSECVRHRKKLFLKKKREENWSGKSNVGFNHRFMSREQLVLKMKKLRKELQTSKLKIRRLGGDDGDEKEQSDANDNDKNGDHNNDNDSSDDSSDDGSSDGDEEKNNGSSDGDDGKIDGSDDDDDD